MVCKIRGIDSPFDLLIDLYDEVQTIMKDTENDIQQEKEMLTPSWKTRKEYEYHMYRRTAQVLDLAMERLTSYFQVTLGSIKNKFYNTI